MGAEAKFIPLHGFDGFDRDVLRWTPTDEPTLIGHIYGGIEASGPNRSATSASAKVFEVRIARAAGTSAIPVQ